MSCLRPKKGFPVGLTDAGKTKYKITSYLTDHVEWDGTRWTSVETPAVGRGNRAVSDWIPIPCGKCYNCKMQYARAWTLRLMLEKTKYPDEQCWFLTLTYKPEELPMATSANSLGVAIDKPTLRSRDMQLFFKRVRKDIGPVRVFYCGEYGDARGRPHYHAIVFGLKLHDLKCVGHGKNGDPLYNSKTLDDEWYRYDKETKTKHNLGYVVVGNVTAKSCGYVARYCLKKAKCKYIDPYIEPEFIRMSRNPGIAADFVADARPIMQADGQEYFLPRFFLKKLEDLDPELAKQYHDLCVELGQSVQENLRKISDVDPFSSGRNAVAYIDKLGKIEYTRLREMEVRDLQTKSR